MRVIPVTIPPDSAFEDLKGWRRVGSDTYIAVQAHVLIVPRRDRSALKGSPFRTLSYPPGSEYSVQNKSVRVIKRAGKIQETIQDTLNSKFSAELASKLASEVGVSHAMPSAKVTTEVQAKAAAELAEAVQNTISSEKSFEIENTEEIDRSISIKGGAEGSELLQLSFYYSFWPCYYDVYLYRLRYLRLRFQKGWFWRNVRDTIEDKDLPLKRPLFRIKYFEPQDEFSISDRDYMPDIDSDDAADFEFIELTEAMPAAPFKLGESLVELAKIAFPATPDEKKAARARRGERNISRTPATAARKSATRKAPKATGKKAAGAVKKAAKAPTKKTVSSGTRVAKTPSGKKAIAAKTAVKAATKKATAGTGRSRISTTQQTTAKKASRSTKKR
jgi:hypothetical protein